MTQMEFIRVIRMKNPRYPSRREMALLDIFKKKKTEKKKEEKLSEVKVAKEKDEKERTAAKNHPASGKPKSDKPKVAVSKVIRKEFSHTAFKVLKSPHVTEKAVNLEAQNKYVFKVAPDSNKSEIKKAIQELYRIKVEDVNIVNIPRKKRRLGKSEGYKQGYKKAIVTVAQGEKIDIGI